MNGKFISFSSIIERVYRAAEYETIPWQDAAEDVIDLLRLIGVPQIYFDRATNGQDDNPIPIVVDNYKGELPMDLAMRGPCRLVHLNGNDEIVGFTAMHETQDLFPYSPTVLEEQNTNIHNLAGSIAPTSIEQKLDLAEEQISDGDITDAADTIQGTVDDIRRAGLRANSSNFIGSNFIPKYKVANGYLYANFKYGFVEMSYKAYPLDEMGMPVVPDDIRYIKAVEWYLISRIDFKRWRMSRNATDERIYSHSNNEALWYIASARSKSKVPSYDMAESIKNMILRSIVKLNEHKNGFKNTDIIEQRKF